MLYALQSIGLLALCGIGGLGIGILAAWFDAWTAYPPIDEDNEQW